MALNLVVKYRNMFFVGCGSSQPQCISKQCNKCYSLSFHHYIFYFTLLVRMGGSAYLAGAGCLSAVLGLIFTLIGFASPYWISFETGTSGATGYVNNYRGIWQVSSVGGPKTCSLKIFKEI